MTRVSIDAETVQQIRDGDGPIELVDPTGQTVGLVRRPPTPEEIARARNRASHGGETLTWDQLMALVQKEPGR